MRTIKILIEDDDLAEIREKVGQKALLETIGYLATWNLTTYREVRITAERNTDLVAYFTGPADGAVGYVIAAVWQDDGYGFHS